MPSVLVQLARAGAIAPPPWLPSNLMFEGVSGSAAYGCAEEGTSDVDLVGYCVPPKDILFPHLAGHIPGFGAEPELFQQYQDHHIKAPDGRNEYDLVVYGLPKLFNLCMQANPNMLDMLYLPRHCIRHSTALSEHIHLHRKVFLSKEIYHRFRGYAYSQMTKMTAGANRANEKRAKTISEHGYDTKFAYNIVRLALECEQLLGAHELVLNRDGNFYRAIRAGEWSQEQVIEWFEAKSRTLEQLHDRSSLPETANREAVRQLLLDCLEMHYGSLEDAVVIESASERLARDMAQTLQRHRPDLIYQPGKQALAEAAPPQAEAPGLDA